MLHLDVEFQAHLGPDFMTYTWLGINVGQVLSVCILGPVVAALGPRAPYCFAAPLEPWQCARVRQWNVPKERIKDDT